MKIKRDPTDAVFSELVRERANWCCETCQRYCPKDVNKRLDCSHIFSRRHMATRWHPENAIAQCFLCHHDAGSDPVEFVCKLETILGRAQIDRMRVRSHGILKVPPYYKKYITAKLRASLKAMKQAREDGERGRIEFDSPY